LRPLVRCAMLSLSLLAAQTGVGWANHSDGQGPKQDLASGTGKIEAFGTFVHVNANGDPEAPDANGSFFVRQTFSRLPLDFAGKVTCLLVTGNKAIVGGEVTRNSPVAPGGVLPNPAVGSGVLIDVRDNAATGAPDSVNFTFRPSPPAVCPALNTHQFPIDQGNYVVHDSAVAAASSSLARSAEEEAAAAFPGG
jgi:hypothetical protein